MNQNSNLSSIADLVKFISNNPASGKEGLANAVATRFSLHKQRSVYVGRDFAIRFSTANTSSFSNVVLSLSALRQYDDKPFIVCVVRPSSMELLLANSTFLKKVSHSSHQLSKLNIKGSFLGHDIIRIFDGLVNEPKNFDELFKRHQDIGWELNLERLVEQTAGITPTGTQFLIGPREETIILRAPELAAKLTGEAEYKRIEQQLSELVARSKSAILQAALINNVNERGNKIEQIITETGNFHALEDISFSLKIGATVLVDVKTKMLSLSSSPKGYNIDKVLSCLSRGNTAFSFFFLGLEPEQGIVRTRLISILDRTIIDLTRVQFHWAGRNSRGVTQLTGDLSVIFSSSFSEHIDIPRACDFLRALIRLTRER